MKDFCYFPIKGIDDVIADKINAINGGNNWSPYRVSTLRGLYDELESTPLNLDNLDDAAKKLIKYRVSLSKGNIKKINKVFSKKSSISKEFSKLHEQLKKVLNSKDRFNRVFMISTMFSDVVDALQAEYPELSRENICKGVKVEDKVIGGQSIIFNRVYEEILSYYDEAKEEQNNEEASKYKDVIDNWAALTCYARMRLRDTEGIKLSEKLEFVDETNESNYSDYVESFNVEESKREAWQEESDKRSSFGSISKEVRRLIGNTPLYDENGEVTDDLYFPVMMDPVRTHQTISSMLLGIKDEDVMLKTLKNKVSSYPWLAPIITELENNNRLRTQFCVDFAKTQQLYSSLGTDKAKTRKNVRHWITKILNNKSKDAYNRYLTEIKLGKEIPSSSLFNEDGSINIDNIKAFNDKVKEYFVEDKSTQIDSSKNVLEQKVKSVAKFWQRDSRGRSILSPREKVKIIEDLLNSLGISLNTETRNLLHDMKNTTYLHKIVNNLVQISKYGITPIVKNLAENSNISFDDFIKIEVGGQNPYSIEESIMRILEITDKTSRNLKYERRARYKDSKGNTTSYDSYVTPSYMGDVFSAISCFVQNKDQKGLREYIENRFLCSSYFYDKTLQKGDAINPEAILNQWVKELYTSNLEDDKSFASNFTFERFLGDENGILFEDFTSKQHLIALVQFYFSDKQINPSSKYAHYPTFILGDSGVAKFIKAKRYSSTEIVDGMYKVFLQEKARMALTKSANKKLKELGHKEIDNFSKKGDEYSILTFLNEEKYAKMIDPNHLEQSVKNVIIQYLKDYTEEFKKKATELGLLDTTTNKAGKTQYVYINQNATPNNVDSVISDFVWNSKFALINQLQFFTIDPAFYIDTKDLQKRYKEIHAPGTILSVKALDFDGNPYSTDSIERCIYFDDISLPATKGFLSAIKANKKTKEYLNKYLKNTLTDGQGYRTLDSYRKVRGMAGQWSEEHEKAYKAIKAIKSKYGKDEKISKDDILEIAKLAVVFQPIKPYMFTHEHFEINDEEELLIPVQHKYAEAVLIPELLPEGMLRDMAIYMEDKNIDMIGSTKIVKVGGFGSVNLSSVKTKEDLDDALSQACVHNLSYEDYRIQTNVPEHLNGSQLFGTQIRKLIMAFLNPDGDYSSYVGGKKVNLGNGHYVTLNGHNLIAFYNALIMSNIVESFDTFASQVNNPAKLSDMFIQNVLSNSRESSDNILAYSLNDDLQFNVPLFEGALEHDAAATLFSLFKKAVNKQMIKGGSAVQVSAFGISGYEERGDLEFVIDPDNPNNILYAECELPFDLSYTDASGNVIKLKYEDWCDENGNLLLDDEIITPEHPEYKKYLSYGKDSEGNVRKPKIENKFPGILSFIAYRIPTERDYSMLNLQIKRFIPKVSGGTIRVPLEGTTIAGFDFDVDKLYFMMREYVATKGSDEVTDKLLESIFGEQITFEQYDFDLPPLENHRVARNNMLIDLIQNRLMDYETFDQRYIPGGFAGASKAARFIRELLFSPIESIKENGKVSFDRINERVGDKLLDPEPNYDATDVMTLITYNQQNQVAGKLIGIFANQNTNHAFASLMESFVLKQPISFCGHSYRDLLVAPPGIDVNLNVAELLSASVDAVKDPVLNYLNLNTLTADAGALLARLGYTTEEIGLLFNQPIIKDICENTYNNQTSLDVSISTIYSNYIKVLSDDAALKDSDKINLLSKESLIKNILNERVLREQGKEVRDNPKFALGQLAVLELFNQIIQASTDVSSFVTTSKFTASNAVGSTFGDMYEQQMKVSSYSTKAEDKKLSFTVVVRGTSTTTISDKIALDISNKEYLRIMRDNPLGYEQTMYDMNKRVIRLLSSLFPYETPIYAKIRSTLASLTRGKYLDATTINSIHKGILAYALSQRKNSLFNGSTKVNIEGTITTARDYYTNIFVKRLNSEIKKNPELKKYLILSDDYCEFMTDQDTGKVELKITNIGGLLEHQKSAITESWEELYEDYPNIARDLFMYNFYKLGFYYSPLSFMDLVPNSLKHELMVDGHTSYIDFLNSMLNPNNDLDVRDFSEQYILNNLSNNRLVFTPKGEALKTIDNLYLTETREAKDSFELDLTEMSPENQRVWTLGTNEFDEIRFRPCILISGIPYIAYGDGSTFNTSKDSKIIYKKKRPLGVTNKSLTFLSSSLEEVEGVNYIYEDTSFAGSTSITPEDSLETPITFNRNDAINEIVEEYKKAFDKYNIRDDVGELYSVNVLRKAIESFSDEDIQQKIDEIKRACRENGILVMDSEGNLMQNC